MTTAPARDAELYTCENVVHFIMEDCARSIEYDLTEQLLASGGVLSISWRVQVPW